MDKRRQLQVKKETLRVLTRTHLGVVRGGGGQTVGCLDGDGHGGTGIRDTRYCTSA